ncbi:MAG: tetratricopeptide repeat protein, partial [Thermoplasmatota archaeon]
MDLIPYLVLNSIPDNPQDEGDSSEIEVLVNKADELSDKGEFEKAIDLYERALKIKDDEVIANNKGVALDSIGRHEKAIEEYDRAISFKEDYAVAWHNKANSYMYLGDHEEAFKC